MIAQVRGQLIEKNPTRAVLDVGGIGLEVQIPITTFDDLPEVGKTVQLFTHLHVREDLLQLYGFRNKADRSLFQMVISVSGVGPRIALGILSKISTEEFTNAVLRENWSVLASVPGIGKKTAQRLVMELRDKLGREKETVESVGAGKENVVEEAILALVSLGYRQSEAAKLVQNVTKSGGELPSLEVLIKKALQSAIS